MKKGKYGKIIPPEELKKFMEENEASISIISAIIKKSDPMVRRYLKDGIPDNDFDLLVLRKDQIKNGLSLGKEKVLPGEDLQKYLDEKDISVPQAAHILGMTSASLYRYIRIGIKDSTFELLRYKVGQLENENN